MILKNQTQVERFSVQGLPAFGGARGDQGSGLKTPKQRSSKGSGNYYGVNAVSPNPPSGVLYGGQVGERC